MSNLDEVFSNFEQKKQAKQNADNERRTKEETQRNESIQALKEVVLPIAEELALGIQQKGYQASIKQNFESRPYPSLEFKLLPKHQSDTDPYSYGYESTLRLWHNDNGQIEVDPKIQTSGGNMAPAHKSSWGQSDITEEKVRSYMLSFIKSVLEYSVK